MPHGGLFFNPLLWWWGLVAVVLLDPQTRHSRRHCNLATRVLRLLKPLPRRKVPDNNRESQNSRHPTMSVFHQLHQYQSSPLSMGLIMA